MVVRTTSSSRPAGSADGVDAAEGAGGNDEAEVFLLGKNSETLEEFGVGESAGADDEEIFASGEDFLRMGFDCAGGGAFDDHFQVGRRQGRRPCR